MGILILLMISGAVHGVQYWNQLSYDIWLPSAVREGTLKQGAQELFKGIRSIGGAFSGLAILPYVVADMMKPEKAKVMMNQAVGRIWVFYMLTGLFGYFGWGAAVKDNIMPSILFADDPDKKGIKPWTGFFWWLAQILSLLMSLKSFTSFPLFVWPLSRELDAYLELDHSPPVTLNLPWAINRLSKFKLFQRLFLLLVVFFVRRMMPHWRVVAPMLIIPVHLCQLILLPIFIVAAIYKHIRVQTRRSFTTSSDFLRHSGNYSALERIFGDSRKHLSVTVFISFISALTGCILIFLGAQESYTSLMKRRGSWGDHVSCKCAAHSSQR